MQCNKYKLRNCFVGICFNSCTQSWPTLCSKPMMLRLLENNLAMPNWQFLWNLPLSFHDLLSTEKPDICWFPATACWFSCCLFTVHYLNRNAVEYYILGYSYRFQCFATDHGKADIQSWRYLTEYELWINWNCDRIEKQSSSIALWHL